MVATKLDYYQLEQQPHQTQLTIKSVAWQRYLSLIEAAAPGVSFAGRVWTDRNGVAIQLHGLNGFPLPSLLEFMNLTYLVHETLDECWVLDRHTEGGSRTPTGQLAYDAKTYNGKPGDWGAAKELGAMLASRIRSNPLLRSADRVVSVPCNPPKEPFSLPQLLGEHVAAALAVPFERGLLVKPQPTKELKHLSPNDRQQHARDAYTVTRQCPGEAIIVVDDIVQTGTTLRAIGDELRGHGASRVIGIAATWAMRGLGW